jgi:hypothetical protein
MASIGLGLEFHHAVISGFEPDAIMPLIDTPLDLTLPMNSCVEFMDIKGRLEDLIYKHKGSFPPFYQQPKDKNTYSPIILPLPSRKTFLSEEPRYHPRDLRQLCASAYFTRPNSTIEGRNMRGSSMSSFMPIKHSIGKELPLSKFKYYFDTEIRLNPTQASKAIQAKLLQFQNRPIGLYENTLFLGIGFIQLINIVKQMMYLVTPLNPTKLSRVNAFKVGDSKILTPRELSDSHVSSVGSQVARDLIGSGPARPRYDLPRKRPT